MTSRGQCLYIHSKGSDRFWNDLKSPWQHWAAKNYNKKQNNKLKLLFLIHIKVYYKTAKDAVMKGSTMQAVFCRFNVWHWKKTLIPCLIPHNITAYCIMRLVTSSVKLANHSEPFLLSLGTYFSLAGGFEEVAIDWDNRPCLLVLFFL